MSVQKGNVSPPILIGIVIVVILILAVLFSNQSNSYPSSSVPIPTSGSEVPATAY